MKLLKVLLILVLLTFPLGELIRIDLRDNIFIKPLDLFVGLTALCVVGVYLSKLKKIPKSYLTKPLVLFSAIALFSLIINSLNLNSTQLITAFLYWIRFTAYAAIYYVVVIMDKAMINKIKLALLLDGLVIIVMGFIQLFLYSNLRNLYYLGWDEHNYRLFSTFLDPNFAGAFLVLFLFFLLGIQMSLREGTTKSRWPSGPRFFQSLAMTKIVLSITLLLTSLAIFLTYSRSALLMLVVGLGTYIILIKRKRYLFTLIGAIILALVFLSPTFNKENTNLLRTTSSFARVETYSNALKIIYDHPILGVGFNAYRYAQESYGFRPVESQFPDHAEAGADNSFLFVTATTGLIGFCTYLFLWYSILKKSFYLYRKQNSMALVVISSSIGLFVSSFFINSLFFPSIMLWMWIMVGLMEKE